eukprot:128571-Prymnesium_polylepis.2
MADEPARPFQRSAAHEVLRGEHLAGERPRRGPDARRRLAAPLHAVQVTASRQSWSGGGQPGTALHIRLRHRRSQYRHEALPKTFFTL